jgi:histone H3
LVIFLFDSKMAKGNQTARKSTSGGWGSHFHSLRLTTKKSVKGGKQAPEPTVKKRRWRPGTVALRQIRKLQRTTDLLIPRLPFQRLVRAVTVEVAPNSQLRYQVDALSALQVRHRHHTSILPN